MNKLKYLVLFLLVAPGLVYPQGAVDTSATPLSLKGGVGVAGNNTWTGTQTFNDAAFVITDDADTSKILNFQLSSISASTTRTYTFPNASGILATTDVDNQVFTGDQIYNDGVRLQFGTSSDSGFTYTVGYTPDAVAFGVPATSNSLKIGEKTDIDAFDFQNGPCGTSACTNPTVIIHSADQVTTEWLASSVTTAGQGEIQSNQELLIQSGFGGATVAKALTESTATAVTEISVAQGVATGGVIHWTVIADDGTDFQSLSGSTTFQAVNPTGTEVCTVDTSGGVSEATSFGTLTNTVSCTVGLTDVVQIAFDAASSLTQTTLSAYYTVFLNGPGTVTPQ